MFEINKRNQRVIVESIIKIIDINIYKEEYHNLDTSKMNNDEFKINYAIYKNKQEKLKLLLNEVAERLETESNNYKQPLETLIEYLYNKHKILFPTNLEDMISAKRELKLWLLI